MQFIVYDTNNYELLAWIDTDTNDIAFKKGIKVISSNSDLGDCVMPPNPPIRPNMMVVPEIAEQNNM